jgi:polysaccharide pyruvyl transferase WcaK-like protein
MIKEQTKNIIFLSPQTQYENLGDLIIIKVLLDNLRRYGNLVINEKDLPEWFCQELEIKQDERASKYKSKFSLLVLKFALKNLFSSKNRIYYILTPGHRFSVNTDNYNFGDYLNYLIKKIQSLATFAVFKILGVRICRFGVSIGPFSTIDEIAEKIQSNLMYFYSVRDTKSETYAKKIGINKVKIFPDLAWLLKVPTANNNLVHFNNEYVILSFRESTHSFDESDTYRKNLFPILDEIVKTVCHKWNKKLLVSYQVDMDYEFNREIYYRYKGDYDVTFIEQKIDSQKMYDLYSRAYMIFSNRLHVLMFATVCGSIPVAVVDKARHDKIIGIFSDAELMQQVIDISSSEHILDLLNNIEVNTDVIKKDLALCLEKYQTAGDTTFKYVMAEKMK